MSRLRSRWAPLIALLSLGAICGAPPPPPEVEYAGCREVLAPAMRCLLRSERELRLWVRSEEGRRHEVRVDGKRADARSETAGDGVRYTLHVPPSAARVDVLSAGEGGEARWFLDLAQPAPGPTASSSGTPVGAKRLPGEHDVIGDTKAIAGQLYSSLFVSDLVGMRRALARLQLPAKAPAEARYYPFYYGAGEAELEGDFRSALAEIDRAAEVAQRVNSDQLLWFAEEQHALLLLGVGRSREAAELFARLRHASYTPKTCEEGKLLNNLGWSALLAREAGDDMPDPSPVLQQALGRYEACAPDKRPGYQVNSMINLAFAHLQEERPGQAERLLATARRLERHPPLRHLLWWLDLDGRIALAQGRPAVARDRFDELENVSEGTSSPDGRLRAALGRARTFRALGDTMAALAVLERAEMLLDEQSLQVPIDAGRVTFLAARRSLVGLHVDLLLDAGRLAEALAAARHARSRVLRQLAHGDSLANLPTEARARRAELLTAYARRRSDLEKRAAAEWKLPEDRIAPERAARQVEAKRVQSLLDSAFAVLGGSLQRSNGALAPPRAGELLLVYHPLEGRSWVAFAADQRTTSAHRFELPPGPLPPPSELARRLLEPFADRIAAARRLRLIVSGRLGSVDFEPLPLRGRPLLAYAPLVYALDIPMSSRDEVAPGRRALLVADPRGDLPGARDEARTVQRALKAAPRHWQVNVLEEESADVTNFQQQLAGVDLLHYAGHGSYSGFGGWDSSLLLAADTRLTLGDLLALPRVPSWVVLAGCETGRSSEASSVASLGLAHAFLLAGARGVVASTRVTYDRDMPRLFADLYREWGSHDLAVALQRAQLEWRRRDPGADWASFRLFEP